MFLSKIAVKSEFSSEKLLKEINGNHVLLLYCIIMIICFTAYYPGVSVVIELLAAHCYGFESCQGLWILLYEEAIQLTYFR